jgi:hypothetical protein
MKRRRLFLMFVPLLLLMVQETSALNRPSGLRGRAVIVPSNNINILVDPRIELLMAVQLISNYQRIAPVLTEQNFAYKRLMIDYLRYHTEHQAVSTIIRLSLSKDFTYSTPLEVMLHLSTPPELEMDVSIDNRLMKRIGGGRNFKRFAFDMKTFSMDADFMEFYTFSGDFFRRIVNAAFYTIEDVDLTEPLDTYVGKTQNSYNFILAPLSYAGTYGIFIGQPDKYDAYCIFGTRGIDDNADPEFGDLALYRREAWHQFGHSFVNPLTARDIDAVNRFRKLFDPIAGQMRKAGVRNWEECVNEHIVRAIMTRLYFTEVGPGEGEKYLREQKERGFLYLDAVIARLADYERNRGQFQTLADFYPQLIDLFRELEQKAAPVRWKWWRIFGR